MNDNQSRLENQPKYKIGQAVEVEITTKDKLTGMVFINKVDGHISVIRASGTDQIDTYEYGVTMDMPGCYHNGKEPFTFIREGSIILSRE